jgi:hypothetical protein
MTRINYCSPATRVFRLCGCLLWLSLILCTAQIAHAQAPPPVPQGEASPRTQAVGLYNLGLKAYKEGSPESAIIFFRRATDIDPTLADAQYNLGVIYMTQKRYQDAIPRFQQVLQLKPNDTDALYQLGIIMQQTDHLDEARSYFGSIPPNSNRFADAQSHLSAIAGKQSGTGAVKAVQPVQSLQSGQLGTPTNAGAAWPTAGGVQAGISPQMSPQAQATQAMPVAPEALNATGSAAAPNSFAIAAQNSTVQMDPPSAAVSNIVLKILAGGFNAPSGLAIDHSGNLYVANYTTNTIDRVNPDGIRTRFSSAVGLKGPIGLALDAGNNLYVANYDGGTILRISPAGVSILIAKGFHKPYYLILDHNNNLYVSQQEDNTVVRISLPKTPAISSR